MVHSSEGCSPPQRRPSLLPQDEHWQGPCLELKENLLINCGGTKVNVEIINHQKLDVVCPFKKTICKVFLVNSLSSQLENDGGKLLGMARGVEAPTFPQFIQVGNEKMPFLRNNTSTPIQGSLSNMILAALLEVTVNGC